MCVRFCFLIWFSGWITRLLCFVSVTFGFRELYEYHSFFLLVTIVVSSEKGAVCCCLSRRYGRGLLRFRIHSKVIKWAIWSPNNRTNREAVFLRCTNSVFDSDFIFLWNQITQMAAMSCDVIFLYFPGLRDICRFYKLSFWLGFLRHIYQNCPSTFVFTTGAVPCWCFVKHDFLL